MTADSRLTRKGQITIPASVRRRLRLKRGDSVSFTVEGQEVRLQRGENVVRRTAAVYKSPYPPLPPELERATVEHLIADDVVKRMGGE